MMNSEVTNSYNNDSRNRAAVWWMMTNVLASSFFPLIVAIGATNQFPLLFTALDNLIACLAILIFMAIFRPRLFLYKTITAVFLPNKDALKINLNLFPCVVRGLVATPFFLLATKHISIVAVVIIYETWPIYKILITEWLFRDSKRFNPVTWEMILLFFFSLTGLAFITVGQSVGILSDIAIEISVLKGVGFALAAAFFTALAPAFSIKHGTMVRESLIHATGEDHGDLFCSMISTFIQRFISGMLAVLLALYLKEEITESGLIAVAIAGVLTAVASIGIRQANLITNNLGINALRYANPVFAMAWLFLFTVPEYVRYDFLLIGAAAVITANLLLNFKAEIRAAYKALIIALWMCGTSVYLHTSFPLPNYIEIVGVIATLFILILAFRVDRLVRRTTEEESNEFFLFHQLSMLAESDGIDKDAPNQLREIGGHVKPSELRNAYDALKQYLSEARGKCTKDDRAMLSELEARVDTLTHSKQQGANFGELTALGFMGFIMVSALLLFKPVELTGWEGLFVETSSFLLATAIVFLFANIFDLQHDRTNAILTKEKGKKYYSVAFDDVGDRGSERWISITVCIAITAAYIWLFLGKWVL